MYTGFNSLQECDNFVEERKYIIDWIFYQYAYSTGDIVCVGRKINETVREILMDCDDKEHLVDLAMSGLTDRDRELMVENNT